MTEINVYTKRADSDIENKVIKGKLRGEEGPYQKYGIHRQKLLYIKITKQQKFINMDNYILYFVVTENGKKSKKNNNFNCTTTASPILTMPQF